MKPTYEDLQQKLAAIDAINRQLNEKVKEQAEELAAARRTIEALAAEGSVLNDFVKICFLAAAEGLSLSGAEIQELGIRLGLLEAETYQPALHGYVCGHETGEDTVYVIKTPATDAAIAEIRNEAGARAVELFAKTLGSPYEFRDEKCYEDGFTRAIEVVRDTQAPRFAQQLRAEASK